MPDAPAATAARALLASAVRHLLVIGGTALVSHGFITQGQADGFTDTLVETIVGTLMVAGATGWAQFRAWMAHGRFAAAWAALNAAVPEETAPAGDLPPYHPGPGSTLLSFPLTPSAAGQAGSDGPSA